MVEVRNLFVVIIYCIGFWCGIFGVLFLSFVVVMIRPTSHFLLLSLVVDVIDTYIRLTLFLNHICTLYRLSFRQGK